MPRPSKIEARSQIVDVIGECVYHALGLKESLRHERVALEEQDTDALHSAVDTKSRCVEKMADLDEQRRALCETSGFHAGPEQMIEMSLWCDEDSVVYKAWSQLMEIAADCNALNLTNGAIIRMRNQMVESNLAVLRGANTNPDTYKREGRDIAAMNQRSLAQA